MRFGGSRSSSGCWGRHGRWISMGSTLMLVFASHPSTNPWGWFCPINSPSGSSSASLAQCSAVWWASASCSVSVCVGENIEIQILFSLHAWHFSFFFFSIFFAWSLSPADIRHPEELSLLKPAEEKKKKKQKGEEEQVYDITCAPLPTGIYTSVCLSVCLKRHKNDKMPHLYIFYIYIF